MTDDFRIANTEDLKHLAKWADLHNFNRGMDVPTDVDPDGIHVFQRILYGHNMDHAPIFHHRCRVLVKIKDSKDPWPGIIDIADADWQKMHRVEDAEAK